MKAKEFHEWLEEWRAWQREDSANWAVTFEQWLVNVLNESLGGL